MIRRSEMLIELKIIDSLNLGTAKLAQADLFAEVLNTADPDITQSDVHRAIIQLATERTTESRGQFLTPADLLAGVRRVQSGDRAAFKARLDEAKRTHGDFTVHQDVSDPEQFRAFKRVAIEAFKSGASVEQARAAAFKAVGRQLPAPESTSHHEVPTHILKGN